MSQLTGKKSTTPLENKVALKDFEEKAVKDLIEALLTSSSVYLDGKSKYETLRLLLINEYGYDSFREWQKTAFKRIQEDHWKPK